MADGAEKEEGKDDNEAIHGDGRYSSVALFGFKRGKSRGDIHI